jgi:hypothetical protein
MNPRNEKDRKGIRRSSSNKRDSSGTAVASFTIFAVGS